MLINSFSKWRSLHSFFILPNSLTRASIFRCYSSSFEVLILRYTLYRPLLHANGSISRFTYSHSFFISFVLDTNTADVFPCSVISQTTMQENPVHVTLTKLALFVWQYHLHSNIWTPAQSFPLYLIACTESKHYGTYNHYYPVSS